MKENEAPEKIYVCDKTFPNLVDWEGSPINTKRIDNHDIEYTRTDAFIEKACEWLNENWTSFVNYDDEDGVVYYWNLTDEFKKFMKVE